MIHQATNLIAETFDRRDVKYRINEAGDSSVVEAGFEVAAGPQVIVRFISNDEDNDVAVRIFGLICRIPESRRTAALEACNRLTGKVRFFKFYLNDEAGVNVEADLPVRTDDGCVGECCFELFVRIMSILDNEFYILTDALYAAPGEQRREPNALLQLLSELRNKPLTVRDNEETELSPLP